MQAKKYLFFPICLIFTVGLFAQTAPSIQWQKCLGGSDNDNPASIEQTIDGGYIVAGESYSNNSDVSGNHGSWDCWVVKLNNGGTIEWQKSLGGSAVDVANSIQQTTDGGYIVAGYSRSNDGDVSGNHGDVDCWIIKLNSSGTIEWQKSLGGSAGDMANSIQQTTDGGYIVAGYSRSNDGDVSGNHGDVDCWIIKLNNGGTIEWQKSLGGSAFDLTNSIQQTTDGGYIVGGLSNSNDGDVIGNHGGEDFWVVKLNSSGMIEWQKTLGGINTEEAKSIQQTTDGGYIVAGSTSSFDGDVSGNHGREDYWVVKLNNTGTIEWQKCLGGSPVVYFIGLDRGTSIQQTEDGGYIVTGDSDSQDGDVSGNHGSSDYWIVKLNSSGVIEWQKCLGGTGTDYATFIRQTTDGGYIIAGNTDSYDGDVSGNLGSKDYWIVKLGADGVLPVYVVSFTGSSENNSTKLNWQITNEINTKDFIVERSADANNFSAIGKVNSQASSALTHLYDYTDNAPLPGLNYYRLKMEDIDGKFTYSKVIRINLNSRNEVVIAPNPVSDYTTISFKLLQKQKTCISIYDMAGRLVKILANTELLAGTYRLSWNAKDENGNAPGVGIYLLKMEAGDYYETKKIVLVK